MRLADPFYYLRNFQTMIDTVRARDGDLLATQERDFIDAFAVLPTRARALLVRMVMRKGALFRRSRLHYPEKAAIHDAVAPLVAVHWVDDRPPLSLEELFVLLPKADLARQFSLPPRVTAKPKAAWFACLRADFTTVRGFQEWCADMNDQVYRLTVDDLCNRLRLMFFGNFRQSLTEFVLADLGVFKFEKIPLCPNSRPFRTRQHVDTFFKLYRCRESLHAGDELAAVERALPAQVEDCEWLADRREKLRFQIGRAHERAGSLGSALSLYAECRHPQARGRAERVAAKIAGVPVRRILRHGANPPEFRLTLDRPVTRVSVETAVRLHLEAATHESTCVRHVENGLINSLFGLLCWRAVFAPVQGAFFHAYHHGPADLSSAGFYPRRIREFGDCLAELRTGSYKDTIRRHYADKSGISSPFVAWGLLDGQLLETSLACFPAAHLGVWFEWILRDPTVNRSGFPDLVQFWPESGRYRLIEIKGPGDRLQDNQRRCLEHCLTQDLPVSVCRVNWSARPKCA
jgi:hypothetical protein